MDERISNNDIIVISLENLKKKINKNECVEEEREFVTITVQKSTKTTKQATR